ncbi:MAG: hypothetical protein ACJA2B_001744 [Candidatus Endobugula sp.]
MNNSITNDFGEEKQLRYKAITSTQKINDLTASHGQLLLKKDKTTLSNP